MHQLYWIFAELLGIFFLVNQFVGTDSFELIAGSTMLLPLREL
jgi:hypothetical protein